MIDARDRVVIGAPGRFPMWAFHLLTGLATCTRPLTPHRIIDRLASVPPLGAGEPGRILMFHFPNTELIEALSAVRPTVVVVDEPAGDTVEHLMRSTNRSLIEAVRVTTAGYVANLALRETGGYLIQRERFTTVTQIVEYLCASLRLTVDPATYRAFVKRLWGECPQDDIGAAVDALLPVPAATGAEPKAFASDDKTMLVNTLLEPMRSLLTASRAPTIHWPVEVHYLAAAEGRLGRTGETIDLIGPARMIYHGPYLHLPPAEYKLGFTVEIGATFAEVAFRIDVQVGGRTAGRFRLVGKQHGRHRAELVVPIDDAMAEVQTQILTAKGAIDGWMRYAGMTLEPLGDTWSRASKVRVLAPDTGSASADRSSRSSHR